MREISQICAEKRICRIAKVKGIGYGRNKEGELFIGPDDDYCLVGKYSAKEEAPEMEFYWDREKSPSFTISLSEDDAFIANILEYMYECTTYNKIHDTMAIIALKDILKGAYV